MDKSGRSTNRARVALARLAHALLVVLLPGQLLPGLALVTTSESRAQASAWPTKPLRLVVPFAPGAVTDQIGRTVAARLSQNLGQPVVVENKAGAGGTLGAELVAHAAGDGYTLLLGEPGSTAINATLMKGQLGFDPANDLIGVSQIVEVPLIMVAHPSLGIRSLAELPNASRQRPLPYGSAGTGTMQHLTVEMLRLQSGAALIHVPYRGGAPAMTDLLSGQLPLLVLTVPTAFPHLQAGKIVPLAVLSRARVAAVPDVATAIEEGYAGFAVVPWQGFFVPAATPTSLIVRLNAEIRRAAASPDVHDKLTAVGNEVVTGTPEAFQQLVRDEIVRWAKVIKEAGVTAN